MRQHHGEPECVERLNFRKNETDASSSHAAAIHSLLFC